MKTLLVGVFGCCLVVSVSAYAQNEGPSGGGNGPSTGAAAGGGMPGPQGGSVDAQRQPAQNGNGAQVDGMAAPGNAGAAKKTKRSRRDKHAGGTRE